MRLRSVLVLGAAALLLLTACAPEAAPAPTPTRSPSTTPTPTPTPETIVEPDAAFDVSCDDVAAEMTALVGEPSTLVEPAMSIVSAPSWLPGPAQYMFSRAAGVACSAGDATRDWEVTLAPGADSLIAGANERGAYWNETVSCAEGSCYVEIRDGDVVLSAAIHDPAVHAGDGNRVGEALHRLAAAAAGSIREVDHVASELVGLPCERYITVEAAQEIVGEEVTLTTRFEGWSIAAEVYEVVNGSRHCQYSSSGGGYDAEIYLMITSLPAGAWAFEKEAGTDVAVDGADAAKTSTGEHGVRYLDLRLGPDWIRLASYDDGTAATDPMTYAPTVIRNLSVGMTAPQ